MYPRLTRPRVAALCATLLLIAGGATPASAAKYKRIVALTPFTANTLADLGVRPAAIGETVGGHDRFNASLNGTPILPLSHPNGPNLEQLALVNPDLVLSGPIWSKGHAGIRKLGVRVVPTEPRSVAELPGDTQKIADIIGAPKKGRKLVRTLQSQIASATAGVRSHPRVLVILGVGRTSYAMLANSWGGDVVRRAGGRLLTDGLKAGGGYARISDEVVTARNPDVIICVPHGENKSISKVAKYMRTKAAWKNTRAVRNGRIYVSTDNSLLQPGTDVGTTITKVRRSFLKNG